MAPARETETPSRGHAVVFGDALGGRGATNHSARAPRSTESDAKYLHWSRESKHLPASFLKGFFSMNWLLPCEAAGIGFPAGFFIFLPVPSIFYKPI